MMFQIFIGIVALSSLLSFINKKLFKLPDTIGVMFLAIIASLFIGALNFMDHETFVSVCSVIDEIDFRTILFDFLLSFLLFAGSIHVNLHQLLEEKGAVLIYATVGVLISTFMIGTLFYLAAGSIGMQIDYIYCLVFGALISPTDPIAVLALLKKAGAPKDMEIKIVGESLFNDGVGIVVFISLLSIATMTGEHGVEPSHILTEFGQEALGGIALGLGLGLLARFFLKNIYEAPMVAVHISIAMVMGGYWLATMVHVSGALAMVVLGLMVGDYLHKKCNSQPLKENMNVFWKVLDEILNAILFVLIGLEIVSLNFQPNYLIAGVLAVPIVLMSRYVSVWISNILLKKEHRSNSNKLVILTWAGLRGGISIALTLTLPEGQFREGLIFITYCVVVFSIIVQGLTIDKVVVKMLNNTKTN
ncbi:cation:proton antiporter [Flagellimonas flava]|uniref:Monovalent cation:H+ antiporter, CPA1 family n=1 Tax=Flagellimonas flava TaxID=570519 RepID=A0A1M5N884_9FLAO|nr:sodium:proton antiporter [Allomuricauda flava]SHG85764.1 monovalent cation:H+ antiporter, CPA1 family [Allomuricauda flava]